jgi:dienelactone hydrolase
MFATLLSVALLVPAAAPGVDVPAVLPEKIDGVAPPEMMRAYLMRRAYEAFDRRAAEYEKPKTPDDVAAYQERMRRLFLDALGGLPERTPLSPQVVAREDRDGYRMEKIIFESRPGHFVTGNLYLPQSEPPYPGVLVPCGHSANGKASAAYQRASILLALGGMAAFCYDPIDQGERYQLLDENGKPVIGGTTAHSVVGVGCALLGTNTATFRVWDGIRAIDYLAGRPEVDAERIGCTGNSGGGTLTSYLMALDERIVAAAPNCYVTSFKRLLETIGPQDAEQNIFGQIAFGMDHADYVMMRAPRPTLVATVTRDFFDIEGSWHSFREAKRLYTRLGHSERVEMIEDDATHGFTGPLRVATARWMRRWLLEIDDAITEPEIAAAPDAELLCTPGGQVMLLDGARSTYDINRQQAAELAAARRKLWQEADRTKALDEVRRVSGIRRLAELPEPKVERMGTTERPGCRIEKLILRPEEGVVLPALAFLPEKHNGQAVLYLHAEGKAADAGEGGPIDELVRKGHLVLAVDLRGLGETALPPARGGGLAGYVGGDWKNLYTAYLLGTSYLAMRAEDVLVAARFLQSYEAGEKPNAVHLWAIDRCGPPALHAAALEPGLFARATFHRCLASWESVIDQPLARNQFANVVHGALRVYDLPDLLGTLPGETVTWSEPVDALDEALQAPR